MKEKHWYFCLILLKLWARWRILQQDTSFPRGEAIRQNRRVDMHWWIGWRNTPSKGWEHQEAFFCVEVICYFQCPTWQWKSQQMYCECFSNLNLQTRSMGVSNVDSSVVHIIFHGWFFGTLPFFSGMHRNIQWKKVANEQELVHYIRLLSIFICKKKVWIVSHFAHHLVENVLLQASV